MEADPKGPALDAFRELVPKPSAGRLTLKSLLLTIFSAVPGTGIARGGGGASVAQTALLLKDWRRWPGKDVVSALLCLQLVFGTALHAWGSYSPGMPMYVLQRIVRVAEKGALLKTVSDSVRLTPLQTALVFNVGTFVSSWRTMSELKRGAMLERVGGLMGHPATLLQLREKGEADIDPRRAGGPTPLKATFKVLRRMRYAIILPQLVQWIALRKRPTALSILRTTVSVGAMPFVFWAVLRTVGFTVIQRLPGVLLTNLSGTICLLIEAKHKRPMLAWFMLATALER